MRLLTLCLFVCCLFFSLKGEGAWSTPVNLSAAGQTGLVGDVAMNPTGSAVAVWTRGNIVQASRLVSGTWSSSVDISSILDGPDAHPRVGIADNGNAVAVWINLVTGGDDFIQASMLNAVTGLWSSPVTISSPIVPGEDADAPQVAVNGSGSAVAIWLFKDEVGGDRSIQANAFTAGAWGTPTGSLSTSTTVEAPQVGINALGQAIAVWTGSVGPNTLIRSANFNGVTWSSPISISVAGQSAIAPQVAVNAIGNAVAVWNRSNGTYTIVQAATSSTLTPGVWSSPVDLSTTGQNATRSAVGIASSGNAVAVWDRFNGTHEIVQSSILTSGTWSSPVDLSATGASALTPQVIENASGQIVVAWERSNGSNSIIQAVTTSGGVWSTPPPTPLNVSVAGQNATNPQVGIASNGDAVAVWSRINGLVPSVNVVQASLGTNFFAPDPPSQLSGRLIKDRFPTQTDTIHRLTWQASPSSDVVSYNIYRNGTLIANIPATSPLLYNDHDRANHTDTYTVTAVSSTGTESTGITIVI